MMYPNVTCFGNLHPCLGHTREHFRTYSHSFGVNLKVILITDVKFTRFIHFNLYQSYSLWNILAGFTNSVYFLHKTDHYLKVYC